METLLDIDAGAIMDSLGDGVYVCDRDRRILYWNRSAEKMTGWKAQEVVGTRCSDGILCHQDKDGHQLCGEDYCPLHRAMITGTGTRGGLLVYAQGKDGRRVPMLVSVAPIRNAEGVVVGGVEIFRDASETVHDLERAKAIQTGALEHALPEDSRVRFATHYIPHDIIGGDYYAIERLDEDRYGVMLADVMGHGIAAALYTMHLSQLWDRFHAMLVHPAEFAARMNTEVVAVVKDDIAFATAVCGVLNVREGTFRFAGAGGPQLLLMREAGGCEILQSPGLPLGVMAEASYQESTIKISIGDSLLLFSDGAVEVMDAQKRQLGVEGLVARLRAQDYPARPLAMDELEEYLLNYSNAIRLEDDLTFIEIRLNSAR
jgi:phosphoserine phosphatase RsbU/P